MVGTSHKSVPGMAIELPFSIGTSSVNGPCSIAMFSHQKIPNSTRSCPRSLAKLVTTTIDEANEWVYCRYIEPVHGVVIQFLIGVDHILTTYINQSTMIYQSDHHIFTYK